ncbi:hypothetical protein H4Q26_004783 [Puccinia striiformis f. sp. tritici PST-130]|nr:hypothetical protein H4Q26_004783 [Puccinia striiformis f. sp. tritici PST-130]
MKDGDHASNYISSFQALQSRLPGWGDHPLINLEDRHSTPRASKEKKRENISQPSQHKKDTAKPASSSTPSTLKFASASKPASKTPSEITKVLEGGRLMANEKERHAKAGLCAYCGGKHDVDDCIKKANKNSGKAKVVILNNGKITVLNSQVPLTQLTLLLLL